MAMPFRSVAPHHHWLKLHRMGEAAPIEDWSVLYGRAPRPLRPPEAMRGRQLQICLSFRCGPLCRYLRSYAEARGVQRREERIADVSVDPKSNGYRQPVDADR